MGAVIRGGVKYSNVTVPATSKNGDLVLPTGAGMLARIVQKQTSTTAVVAIGGVLQVKKKAGQAWALFANLYYETSTSSVTTTQGSNIFVGVAAEPAASADTTGEICLNRIPLSSNDI